MPDFFSQSLARNYDHALDELRSALTDCPDEMWETDLWPDEAPTQRRPDGGLAGSAPWLLAHHALVCLDYDLTGDFERFSAPPPFDESVWWVFPTRVFTKAEMLAYVDWCRNRVHEMTAALTPELAARPLPAQHRYHGTPHGLIVSDGALHTMEHAAQIRQFLRAAGIRPT